MSSTNPIERSRRSTDFDVSPGQRVFGPTPWLAFDPADIVVLHQDSPESGFVPVTFGVTVTLNASPVGTASVSFDAAPGGAAVRLLGRRVHVRTTDVTRAGALQTALLERELDTMAVVLQELARDAGEAATRLETFDAEIDATLDAADAAAAEARGWAEQPYGEAVPGFPAGRSAVHWAEIAQQWAAEAAAVAALVGSVIYDFGLLSDDVVGEEDWGTL